MYPEFNAFIINPSISPAVNPALVNSVAVYKYWDFPDWFEPSSTLFVGVVPESIGYWVSLRIELSVISF